MNRICDIYYQVIEFLAVYYVLSISLYLISCLII